MTAVSPYNELVSQLKDRAGARGPLSLLSFSIAGVHEFLAQARTTRDVWNGSYLLSHLAWRATQDILEEIGKRYRNGAIPLELMKNVLLPDPKSQPFAQRWASQKIEGDLSIANFPNTIMLLVPATKREANDLGRSAAGKAGAAWNEISEKCRKAIEPLGGAQFFSDQWQYQTDPSRIFEFYWSAMEVPEDENALQRVIDSNHLISNEDGKLQPSYAALMSWASGSMAAHKLKRAYDQIGQDALRCSLCGTRSALADYRFSAKEHQNRPKSERRDAWRRKQTVIVEYGRLREYWEKFLETRRFDLRHKFRSGDRLCAVCTTRRLAPEEFFEKSSDSGGHLLTDFPSTSSLAAADAVAKLIDCACKDDDVAQALEQFVQDVRELKTRLGLRNAPVVIPGAMLPFFENRALDKRLTDFASIDGDWLFEETYGPAALEREFGINRDECAKILATYGGSLPLPRLRAALKAKELGFAPDNYVALLMLDGDGMGNLVFGRLHPDRFDLAFQSALSKAAAEFASRAVEFLQKQMPGRVVYAGGDDLLAFLPAAHALKAIQKLQALFRECVEHVEQSAGLRANTITVSIACVLAKHDEPLAGAVRFAEKLLNETAKDRYGRNGFAIYRTTAGIKAGTQFTIRGKDVMKVVTDIASAMSADDGLSSKIAYDIEQLRDSLSNWKTAPDANNPIPGLDQEFMDEARVQMLSYLADRHSGAGAPGIGEKLRELYRALSQWAQDRNPKLQGRDEEAIEPLTALVNLMLALRFLTRTNSKGGQPCE